MELNKRSYGNRCDSLSGHTLMIGCLSKKIITGIVSSNICRQCSKEEENDTEPPQHVCSRNYNGSSKAMEVDAVLHLYIEIFERLSKMLYLKTIVADDDSSMRVLFKHQNNNTKDRLPEEMIEPEWLSDPSRRTKVVAKPIYQLAISSNKLSSCTKLDAIRFKNTLGI